MKIEPSKNPYDAPKTTELAEGKSDGRAPTFFDNIVLVLFGLVAAVVAFSATCFGSFWAILAVADNFMVDYEWIIVALIISILIGVVCAFFSIVWCVKNYVPIRFKRTEPRDSESNPSKPNKSTLEHPQLAL